MKADEDALLVDLAADADGLADEDADDLAEADPDLATTS
eukprot:CAMPEP_0178522534 /NCGR_PEP_ID=MMETSP0696-20121128/28589_1 /TAXON_ID=265572 /ORGANISM="Extubocellulus spinifer, Strain CCMP396" /LENGTH=38 /DNA_ID= /DNA_START= /DNA_END= /DNA_ORIENTATION=